MLVLYINHWKSWNWQSITNGQFLHNLAQKTNLMIDSILRKLLTYMFCHGSMTTIIDKTDIFLKMLEGAIMAFLRKLRKIWKKSQAKSEENCKLHGILKLETVAVFFLTMYLYSYYFIVYITNMTNWLTD